ncbi:putative entry exclusion protein TrbK-alt [Bradyrhizobium sp.]|jgi:conjugative transfer region protein TrbK|uniref:putative entry exclusion protein TrbK-alt n=1 Tax=Bradyrhizobium sp. TaxID=376 RepID=UPI00391C08C4
MLTPWQLTFIAKVAFIVWAMAAAVVQSQHGKDASVLTPTAPSKAEDALATELARCRTILPDDPDLLESCRHIWADNRQHFFLSPKSLRPQAVPVPYAPLEQQHDEIPRNDVGERRH